MSSAPRSIRRLILLGSTGSIGVSTLQVVEHLRALAARGEASKDFQIVGLAAGRNVEQLLEQAAAFDVPNLAVANGGDASTVAECGRRIYTGPDSAREMIEAIAQPGDLVVGAMVGSAGVPATIAAIERGCDIALANKETLVAAGEIVLPLVKKHNVNLLPIDSEHSAIFQCMLSGKSIDEVRRLVITASGGPFRTWSRQRMVGATVEQALNHPTWNMGPKVTIDSASLMNKALEVIEAHWLFDLPAEKIEAIIHPQSIIHSFVEFVDGSVIAQLGPPDMKTPIQYALTWPHRVDGCSRRMEWAELNKMDFEAVDHEKFPSLGYAYQVIEQGGTSGAVLNAANEASVEAFLAGEIPFGRILQLVGGALQSVPIKSIRSLDDVMDADRAARQFVHQHTKNGTRQGKSAPISALGTQH